MNTPIKLKVELKDLPHKCIRTLLVPENLNMRQLHFIVQEAFGWLNEHLFEFKDAKWRANLSVGVPDDFDMDFGGSKMRKAHTIKLKETFLKENGAKGFWYWYDFGNDWWHRISFLKVSQKDLKQFKGVPLCIKAEGKCPPEDIGGPWGYSAFLETMKDKNHPEHEEMREWYGLEENEAYDENEVDLEEINQLLNDFYNSKEWKSKSYDMF